MPILITFRAQRFKTTTTAGAVPRANINNWRVVMNKHSVSAASRWVASFFLVLLGQQASAITFDPFGPKLKGVWNARVNITNCLPGNVPGPIVFDSFYAINTYAADGTFLDTNSRNPATQSTHLGYWRHLHGNKYEFAVKFFMFDAGGASAGWRIVRHEIALAHDGMSFSSAGTAETFDNNGVLLTTGCSTSTALRFD
jgi:hypothetical protein